MSATQRNNARPVLVVQDVELGEEVARLAAASGSEMHRHPRLLPAVWREAPLVVLDAATAEGCATRGLPRRRGVVLVCRQPAEGLWRIAFQLGVERVIELPVGEIELIELLSDADEPGGHGRVVAVLGGCGGAGASTFATAMAAHEARSGRQAMLVDCDALGGGLDLVLGMEHADGLRWSGVAVGHGRLGSGALISALPTQRAGNGDIALLSCDSEPTGLTPDGLRAVLDAGRRSGATVICDLPRALGDTVDIALREAELAIVVLPAEVRACAAAVRLVANIRDRGGSPVQLVVRGPAPGGLRMADVAEAVGIPVLAGMRSQPGLPAAADRGVLLTALRRGPIARAAQKALAELARAEPPGVAFPTT